MRYALTTLAFTSGRVHLYELTPPALGGTNRRREMEDLPRERVMLDRTRLGCNILLVSTLLASNALQAGEKDVNVINTPDVVVVNTPDVNVANLPDVFVTNDASDPVSVKIENGASQPIPVVNATAESTYPRQPFFLRADRSGTGISLQYTVPSDRILVIESVNVSADQVACSMDKAASAQVTRIRPQGVPDLNGPEVNLIVVPLVQTSPCGSFGASMGASLATRMYAMPNSELLVRNASQAAGAVITYTGYLIPADSPSLAP
jgi:hypothetical protein